MLLADVVVPSLNIEEIVKGIEEFSRVYNGELWLEIMLVNGINDSEEEIFGMKRRTLSIPRFVRLKGISGKSSYPNIFFASSISFFILS